MDNETIDFYKRMRDLSRRSFEGNQYTFTGFLSMAEFSDFMDQIKLPSSHQFTLYPSGYSVFGGYEAAERVMVRFGNEKEFMYEQEFPIECLLIKPLNAKFADNLSHRDYLGAIMNLGIERSKLGDILIKNNNCYIFVDENLSELIISELTKVKHTSIVVSKADAPEEVFTIDKEECLVQASSQRIDGIVAKAYKLSRSQSANLFLAQKVFVNGRLMQNESHQLNEGDVVAVRGFGKFEFSHISGNTRKGNLCVVLNKYV